MILAHQTSSQLVLRDADLRPVVRDNANKLYLTATTEDDVKELLGYSLDTAKLLRGVSIQRLQSATSTREVIEPILERNDVLTVSNTFLHGFLVLDDGQGHKEPIRLVVTPPCSKTEYERLKNTPLPRYPDGERTVFIGRRLGAPIPGADARRGAVQTLLDALKKEETWQLKQGGEATS
jgi:hypothetical protein